MPSSTNTNATYIARKAAPVASRRARKPDDHRTHPNYTSGFGRGSLPAAPDGRRATPCGRSGAESRPVYAPSGWQAEHAGLLGNPQFLHRLGPRNSREPEFGVPAGKGVVVDPPDGKIPYQPWALAKRNDVVEHHMFDDPQAHCWLSGVPRQM